MESRVRRLREAPRVIDLDVRQMGLGGGSCGPEPMKKYVFPIENTVWTLRMEPVSK